MKLHIITLALLCLLLASIPFSGSTALYSVDVPPETNSWTGLNSIVVNATLLLLLLTTTTSVSLLYVNDNWYDRYVNALKSILTTYGGYWWVTFFLWASLNHLWARDPSFSRYHILHLMLSFFLVPIISVYVRLGYAKWLLGSLVWSGIFQSILAGLQLVSQQSLGLTFLGELQRNKENPFGYGFQNFRGSGLEFHPNILAGFLLIAFFAAAILLVSGHWRRFAFVGGAVILLGIMATVSRTTLAIVPLILLILWATNTEQLPHVDFNLKNVTLVSIVFIFIGILATQGIFNDLTNRTQIWIENPHLLADRLVFAADDSLQVIEEAPIHGVGMGMLNTEIAYNHAGDNTLLLPVHNSFLYIWAELGLVGLGLFCMGLFSILWRSHPRHGVMVFIVGGAFSAVLLEMLFDFYFWGFFRYRLLVFCWLGISYGYKIKA